jgi:hypothetical protein
MQRIVLAIALGGALCGCATHRAAASHASVSLSEPVTTWRDKIEADDLTWIETLSTRIRVMPPFFCYIRGESDNLLTFAKQTGTDLPGGWLYPDDDKRYVFLGARQRRSGDTSLAYGADRVRDVIGVAERIGSFRWRLEIRGPARDGLDVYELTPVPTENQPPQP